MKKIFAVFASGLISVAALGQTFPSPTFNSLTLQNPLTPTNGGTGVANSSTITLGGNLTTSGSNPLTLTTTGSTNITLPTSGTLLSTGSSTGTGSAVLANSPTIASPTITGAFTATGLVTTADLAAQAANTVLANVTGSSASPTAFAMPSCSTSASALTYTSGTGFTCNTAVVASNVSGTVAIANGGTNATTAAAALTNLGADAVGNTTNKDVYVSTAGNDSNNGTSWGYAKLTLQAAINAANPGGIVHVGAGTFSLTSTLAMQPNVNLQCAPGAIITQPNATNLSVMIDWSANTANGASIQNCVIDGNRSGNTDNAGRILLYPSTANDVILSGNTIRNGSGIGAAWTTGLRPIITNNKLSNFYTMPLVINTGVSQTATYGQISGNAVTEPIGQHAIQIQNSDWNVVTGNTINGFLQTGMTVSTSGTTVTSTGGPNFSTLHAGEFIILNGGTELNIISIQSNTSLTVNTSAGTLTNVPAAAGPGDLLSIADLSSNVIANNLITGGVGGGIVLSNFLAGESAQKNNIIGNTVSNIGEGCIEIEGTSGFSNQIFDTAIRGNSIFDCGKAGAAGASNTLYGIALIDFASGGTVLNTFVDGNYIRDDQGTPTTTNWMGLSGLSAGQVFVGKNTNIGTTSNGISGGISSVTLSSGWGSTSTVTGLVSYGDSFQFTVNTSGTGFSSSPTATVHTVATTATNPPVMACQNVGGSQIPQLAFGQIAGTNTAPSATVFIYNGTPSASNTYTFLCRG